MRDCEKLKENDLSLIQIFLNRTKQFQDRTALRYPSQNGYQSITWTKWARSVELTALGLSELGVTKNDCVALISENRPEWTYVDLGCLSLGAPLVPIYPTSSYPDVQYILKNSGAKVLVVSSQEQCDRLRNLLQDVSSLEKIILFDSTSPDPALLNFDQLLAMGDKKRQTEESGFYEKLVEGVLPDDLATIIYTSGTTGPPKGVMLTHRNFVENFLSAQEIIPVSEADTSLSFLPLCHVFERLAGYYFMVFHGAVISYARSMQTVAEDIQIVKPTVAAAVPRFYEKIHAKIIEKVEAGSPLVKKLFHWSVNVGCSVAQKRMKKEKLGAIERLKYQLAKLIVFNKLKRKLGGNIRFFISGGAPLPKALGEFFYAADILILEGYGLTETSPVIAVNPPDAPKYGTVGLPLSVAKVKIAEDGEILTKGACIMKGYYQNPEATAQAISEDGWFHTGDIGELDQDGYLKITDRKKDIIVTSGGKNVSPQNIENLILSEALFSQIVIVGDKRNYLVALVVPNPAEIASFAEKEGLDSSNYENLLKEKLVYEYIEKRLQEKIGHLSSYEQIKYFTLLPTEFTQEGGELTPTLKIKRKRVIEKYSDLIDSLYEKGESYKSTTS